MFERIRFRLRRRRALRILRHALAHLRFDLGSNDADMQAVISINRAWWKVFNTHYHEPDWNQEIGHETQDGDYTWTNFGSVDTTTWTGRWEDQPRKYVIQENNPVLNEPYGK